MCKCMYMKCLQYELTPVMVVMTVMQNGDGDAAAGFDDLGHGQCGEGNDDNVDDVDGDDDDVSDKMIR